MSDFPHMKDLMLKQCTENGRHYGKLRSMPIHIIITGTVSKCFKEIFTTCEGSIDGIAKPTLAFEGILSTLT